MCQYRSGEAQSFVSVAEVDTRWYGPWHCQHEAPPPQLSPPFPLKSSDCLSAAPVTGPVFFSLTPLFRFTPRILVPDHFQILSVFFFSSGLSCMNRGFCLARLLVFRSTKQDHCLHRYVMPSGLRPSSHTPSCSAHGCLCAVL